MRNTEPSRTVESAIGMSSAETHALLEAARRESSPGGLRGSGTGRRVGGAMVIAVTSGKGGVGKSNVAVNLSAKFAAMGRRVLLVDADLGLANADVLCGVEVPFNLSHVVARRRSVREVLVRVPVGNEKHFDLVGGASGLSRMADLDEEGRRTLLDSLCELERGFDVMVIDTGAGISANVLAFCRSADHVLVVTTPEPTAVTDAYAMIKTLSPGFKGNTSVGTATGSGGAGSGGAGGGDRQLSVLVNQVASQSEGRAVYERVARVARQFLAVSVMDAGHVVFDPEVTQAVRRRKPLVSLSPSSSASKCITQLAARLEPGFKQAGGSVANTTHLNGTRAEGARETNRVNGKVSEAVRTDNLVALRPDNPVGFFGRVFGRVSGRRS